MTSNVKLSAQAVLDLWLQDHVTSIHFKPWEEGYYAASPGGCTFRRRAGVRYYAVRYYAHGGGSRATCEQKLQALA